MRKSFILLTLPPHPPGLHLVLIYEYVLGAWKVEQHFVSICYHSPNLAECNRTLLIIMGVRLE